MNNAQRNTVIGIDCSGLLFLGWVAFVLAIEFVGVAAGQDASISRMFWGAWATQPWVIYLVSVVAAFVAGFLAAHFTAQSDKVYQDIREGKRRTASSSSPSLSCS